MATATTCQFCGRSLPSADAVREHIRVAHASRPWAPRCEICNQTFESPADLKAHNESVHQSGKF
jgi:Zinc-finger of C2H2 type/Zinc finger, C2H2 type